MNVSLIGRDQVRGRPIGEDETFSRTVALGGWHAPIFTLYLATSRPVINLLYGPRHSLIRINQLKTDMLD